MKLVPFDDVQKLTGYPAGGVPPHGFNAIWVMDEKVTTMDRVLAGGGTIYSLLLTTPDELIEKNNPIIMNVIKK